MPSASFACLAAINPASFSFSFVSRVISAPTSIRSARSTKTSQPSTFAVAAPAAPLASGPAAVISATAIEAIAACIGSSSAAVSRGARIATFTRVFGGTFCRARISRIAPTTARNVPNCVSVRSSTHEAGGAGHADTMIDFAGAAPSQGIRRPPAAPARCCQISSVTNGMIGWSSRRIVSRPSSSIDCACFRVAGSARRALQSSRYALQYSSQAKA